MTIRTFVKTAIKAILPYGIVVYIKRIKLQSRFLKVKQRAEKIAGLLADEHSKKVYLGIIKARYGLGIYSDFYTKQVQYFENEYFKYGDDEFLIDCGAYDGNTIDDFIKFVPNFKGIISFEATPATFEILKKNYGNNPKIQLINKACWSESTKLTFKVDSRTSGDYINAGNRIIPFSDDNTISIEATSIDALELQEKVTFIKMDIEGAELEALKGAKKTILRDKPRLAIAIYHSNEDMFCIAEYIHEIMPEYKLYVKHHWINSWETILYGCI
ncbi:hypothetical protein R83H12_01677 [Fibrobacteria bacterium R8-3-H12]